MTQINLPNERHVGHLTLLRQGRKISVQEYNALSRSERMAMIRQANGKQKYDLLINASDANRLTAQLHPQELYLTVNEIGSEYAVELLAMATAEQITTLLDMDCWDGDSVSPVLSLTWLQLLLDTGAEKVCQLVQQIEPEILAIFLKKHMVITRGLEVYDDDDAENANRLESLYDIDFASEDAAKIIGAFLKIIMEQAQDSYLLLMEMIRSEMASTLEEEVYQARNNRLSDLGFVTKNEAQSIYATVDPDNFTPGGKNDYRLEADELPNPGALLAQAAPENLLAEVLTNGLSHELATELCMLANRKMSADSTDISSPSELGSSLQELYNILNLALEHLAGKNVDKAIDIVAQTYLQQLFQLGHSLLKRLQTQAKQLLLGPLGPFFDYPEQLFLDALMEKPPVLYREATEDQPSSLEPITTSKELVAVSTRLLQIKELETLFCGKLPFSLPEIDDDEEADATLSTYFLTAVGNRLLGRDFIPAPLSPEDLLLLKSQTISAGSLSEELVKELNNFIQQSGVNYQTFINFCLECWHDDLTAFDLESFDPEEPFCFLLED
ncbi:hypothetical protein SAMN02745165_00167 [Malonomonas rubra DSM 5091]|uniref:Uncharacterized protein n=1 Tax=Malonomonas rubra DSM 5091 TaxID=1122189 RepID=A0A1M6BGB5_MALRU|nr:DUF6178 family protein [Malonomonas rubra]SHI47726.1 hypothetical protein SAMN02745165_00167 [Malonomonas rubra DSM 5091]